EQGFDVVFERRANTKPSAEEGGKGEYELTASSITRTAAWSCSTCATIPARQTTDPPLSRRERPPCGTSSRIGGAQSAPRRTGPTRISTPLCTSSFIATATFPG